MSWNTVDEKTMSLPRVGEAFARSSLIGAIPIASKVTVISRLIVTMEDI